MLSNNPLAFFNPLLAYLNISICLLLLLVGGLILFRGPNRKVNQALFLTALLGAIVMILNLLAREPSTFIGSSISTGFEWDIIRPAFDYLFIAAWYLEFWLFLQYLLEYRWESLGVIVEKQQRRRIRLLTFVPILLWIAFLIAFASFKPAFGTYMYRWHIYYETYSIPAYFHLIFTVLYIMPLLLLYWRKPRSSIDGTSTGKNIRVWLGLIMLGIGLGILITLGPQIFNILLLIFSVVVLLNLFIGNRKNNEQATIES